MNRMKPLTRSVVLKKHPFLWGMGSVLSLFGSDKPIGINKDLIIKTIEADLDKLEADIRTLWQDMFLATEEWKAEMVRIVRERGLSVTHGK